MGDKTCVSFTLNGEPRSLELEPRWTLLHVLREVYNLTGTKFGCGTNDCGSCKVLIDDNPVNSCVYPAKKLEGKRVLTIEGISSDKRYMHIPQAFVDAHAVQCGFCTPGMVVTALGLLLEDPDPDETKIRSYFTGNLCRCTGYVNIVEAVNLAAGRSTHG